MTARRTVTPRSTARRRPRAPNAPLTAPQPTDSLGTAAYLDIARLNDAIQASYQATRTRLGGNPLHDLRVSLRRLRQAIRVYQPVTRHTKLPALADELGELTRGLGAARDGDVWLGRVRRWGRTHAEKPSYRRYAAHVERAHASDRDRLSQLLQAERTRALLGRLAEAVADREVFEGVDGGSIRSYAACELRALYRKLLRSKAFDPSPEGLHRLRARVRKARYLGECAQPVVGVVAEELTAQCKRIADALGAVHDMDVALERERHDGVRQPQWLVRHIKAYRRKYFKMFERAWERLHDPHEARRVLKELKAIGREPHMRLFVVRHGIAVNIGENGVRCDEDRMLSKRGRARTEAVGAALTRLGWKPDRILTSPLVRAAETARILAKTAPGSPRVVDCEWLTPETSLDAMLTALARRKGNTLVLVGHMPGLGELLGLLLSGDAARAVALRKAGVCCLEFDGRVRAGGGHLCWLMQPRQLLALGP